LGKGKKKSIAVTAWWEENPGSQQGQAKTPKTRRQEIEKYTPGKMSIAK